MKKNMIIIAILLMFSITSFAQTEKGKFMIGGNASFAKIKQFEYKANEFNISPLGGYFIVENLAVGVGLDYTLHKSKSSKGESIAVMPFARYYFGKYDKLRFFGHAGMGLASGRVKGTVVNDRNYSYSSRKFTYKGGIGAAYFFTKNIALEGMLQYDNIKYDNSIGFNIGLKIHF